MGLGHGVKGRDASFVAPAARPFHVGRWRIEPASREMTDGVATKRLSPRALGVLDALVAERGRVVSRADLMDHVWPDVHVGDESLTQAVAELRRAFGDRPGAKQVIETVPRAGYRLNAPVLAAVAAGDAPDAFAEASGASRERLPLDAYVNLLEGQWLARRDGHRAAAAIQIRIDDAAASAPEAASVQAEYAVLTALAAVYAGDRERRLEAANAAAVRAVVRRPDLPAAHRAQAFVAGTLGHGTACRAALERSLALDADDPETHYVGAQSLLGLGAFRAASALAERAAALKPDDYRPSYLAARAALRAGDRERARVAATQSLVRLEAMREAQPRARRLLSARGALRAMLGGRDDVIAAASSRAPDARYFYDVVALAHAGAVSEALDALEALVDDGWRNAAVLRADPIYETLRGEPRFARLTRPLLAA